MSENSVKSKRIAKNSFLLYVRMLLLTAISLYTSRIILNALGVIDYGIYNVVGGMVTMFSMISGSLSSAISRFLTIAIGKKEIGRLSVIFSTSVNIQFLLALLIIILMETIGLWFLEKKMVIPDERLTAAWWVFQFSVLTFVINLISIPYNAIIIAHERMSAFAYISILEAIGKLVIAYCIVINPIDRLVFFALMITLLSVIIRFIYGWYCRVNFRETIYHFVIDKRLLKEMFGFAGWNFLGSSAMILREYGGNLIINLFCGPSVNASRAIAGKVNSTVQGFINNFTMAINPQITKSYASGDFDYMFNLIYQGSRLSFYMMLLLSMPILLNAHYILQLWLGVVPDYTVSFVCLILLLAMSDILSNTLITALLAVGRVRNYQIVVSTLQMLNLPISYCCLRWWSCPPESVIIVAIILSNIALFVRLYMLRKLIPIKIATFICNVYLNAIIVTLFSSLLPVLLNFVMAESFKRLIIVSLFAVLNTLAVTYFIGCSKSEQLLVKKIIANFILHKIQRG